MKPSPAVERFRRKPGARPLVFGHRGARAHAPENTLRAFEEALAQGADGIELDVRSSADGELFIAHDDELALARDESQPVRLSELTRAEIERLAPRSGEPVPFLDEILAWQRRNGTLLNIELKGNLRAPLALARRAKELIRTGDGSGLILSSFHPLIVARLVRSLPGLPVGLLFDRAQVEQRRVVPYRLLGAHAVHPEERELSEAVVRRYRALGALVNVWTVNSPSRALELSGYGVDALITDSPRTILAALAASPGAQSLQSDSSAATPPGMT